MPKDRERYRYVDVGLERGSWTLTMFEEDAKRHQMSDQPGKLITVRLTEYYEWKNAQAMPSSKRSSSENGRPLIRPFDQPNQRNGSAPAPGTDILEISHHATENADEAALYWAGIER